MRGVFCFLVFGGSWSGQRAVLVRAGAGQCGFRAGAGVGLCCVGVGLCSFRAGVSAVFILNGMIFSFLDEKRVFKGVV